MSTLRQEAEPGRDPVRRKLSNILTGGADSLRQQWDRTQAAGDFKPLPAGIYVARVVSGELFTSRTNTTPGYKLTFKVLDGEHAGRQFWHEVWLTPAALPMAKRDLGKLGVTDPGQLERPLPTGIRCSVKLALRTGDDGVEHNRVRSFDVLGIDADPTADPDFGPVADQPLPPPNGNDQGVLIDTAPAPATGKVGLPDV